MIASTFERYQTIDQNNNFDIYSEGIILPPIRSTHQRHRARRGFLLFLFKILFAFSAALRK